MASVNIHSASPISSVSSMEDTLEDKTTTDITTPQSTPVMAPSMNTTTLREDPATFAATMAKLEDSIPESAMEDVPLSHETPAQASTPELRTSHFSNEVSTSTRTTSSPSRSVPRLHTRKTSLSANIDLPWKIDNTSSASTWAGGYNSPTYQRRSSSIAPPPKAGETALRSNVDGAPSSPYIQARDQSPHHASPSPSQFTHTRHSSSSPYSSMSSTSYTRPSTPPHVHSLTHPPGYHQNTQAIQSNTAATAGGGNALYTSNTSPLYSSNSPFNFPLNTSSFPSLNANGSSPTRGRTQGRGILDNDPSIYLGNGDEATDDDTMWDTATRWAKAASKRLSTGDIGLWKLVGGEER